MEKKRKCVIFRLAFIVVILTFLLASGPVWAQAPGATQGQVALNLANLLGLSLPVGATQADAINALTALGIIPCERWQANVQWDSNFIGCLYGSVQAAITAGKVSPGALGSASAVVAAAGTQANIPRMMAVNAIVGAGGDRGDANQGASYGGTYGAGGGGYGPGYAGGGGYGPGYGRGGGGGGVNPSPSR